MRRTLFSVLPRISHGGLPKRGKATATLTPPAIFFPGTRSPGIPPVSLRDALAGAKKYPLAFAVACGMLKDGSCDVVTQSATDPDAPWDARRTAVFASFGAVFVGAWQYYLFSRWLPKLIPTSAAFEAAPLAAKLKNAAGVAGVAAFVAVENLLNQPLAHFPTLYAIKYRLEHGDAPWSEVAASAVATTRRNFWEDNFNSLCVWVPATLLNGFLVPLWARVPFMTLCGCGWTSFMSYTRGAPSVDADGGARAQVSAALEEAFPSTAPRPAFKAAAAARAEASFTVPPTGILERNAVWFNAGAGAAWDAARAPAVPAAVKVAAVPRPLSPTSVAAVLEQADGDTISTPVVPSDATRGARALLAVFDERTVDFAADSSRPSTVRAKDVEYADFAAPSNAQEMLWSQE